MTSNHSIYSADHLDFVPAGELRVGETLRNLDGDVRIESIEQLSNEERVYNLEVHGEHVFRVASSGMLVHNSSGATGSSSGLDRGANKSVLSFNGVEVRAVRGLSHVKDGTLRQMAKDGFAAKDANGKTLVLHHLKQNPAGPLVEMPGFRHTIQNSIQHPFGNAKGVGLSVQQRAAHDAWRVEYWRARAIEELAKRGITP